MELLMIGAAARLLDRSVESLRAYERDGKLIAIRTSEGRRLFRREDVEEFARKFAEKRQRLQAG